MSVAIYMDEHVPAPITLGLRERDVDVLTAQEDGHGVILTKLFSAGPPH